MRFIYSLLIIAVIFIVSCDEKPCYEDMHTYFNIGFYQVEDSVVVDSVLDSLRIYADKSNFGLIFKNTAAISSELSPQSDSTLFFITINNNNGDDYIQLRYTREYQLVSHDCGFVVYFRGLEIIDYSTYFIDSVAIINEDVNDVNEEHIKIYL